MSTAHGKSSCGRPRARALLAPARWLLIKCDMWQSTDVWLATMLTGINITVSVRKIGL